MPPLADRGHHFRSDAIGAEQQGIARRVDGGENVRLKGLPGPQCGGQRPIQNGHSVADDGLLVLEPGNHPNIRRCAQGHGLSVHVISQ